MLSEDQEKAVVLLAFASAGGNNGMSAGCVAQALQRIGRDSTNVSHSDFVRLQGKVEDLNRVLNDTSYRSIGAGCDTGIDPRLKEAWNRAQVSR